MLIGKKLIVNSLAYRNKRVLKAFGLPLMLGKLECNHKLSKFESHFKGKFCTFIRFVPDTLHHYLIGTYSLFKIRYHYYIMNTAVKRIAHLTCFKSRRFWSEYN